MHPRGSCSLTGARLGELHGAGFQAQLPLGQAPTAAAAPTNVTYLSPCLSLAGSASVSVSAAADPCQAPLGLGGLLRTCPLSCALHLQPLKHWDTHWPGKQIRSPTPKPRSLPSGELFSCTGEPSLEGKKADDPPDSGLTSRFNFPFGSFLTDACCHQHTGLILHFQGSGSCVPSRPSLPQGHQAAVFRSGFEEQHRTRYEPGLLGWQRCPQPSLRPVLLMALPGVLVPL